MADNVCKRSQSDFQGRFDKQKRTPKNSRLLAVINRIALVVTFKAEKREGDFRTAHYLGECFTE